ncbi:MAG: DNA topoisomerase VI subunit B [Candidatus Aenigmatarchaeota archaeon]
MDEKVTAEQLAEEFREISVAEFFEKNRHLLGYENPTKALITVVKEAVDNSLDAANEVNMLPEIKVSIKETGIDRFKVVVEDNGPGIVPEKIPLAFGKLLYGTKFHKLRQSRGTQGIGISGAVLYSQLTTGKPVKIISSTGKDIHIFDLMIDVTKNSPHILAHKIERNPEKWHGIKIELEVEGRYVEGKQSILEYLKQTAIANPYARIIYHGPTGKITFERVTNEIPTRPKEIKPHPYGVQLGVLRRMAYSTKARNLISFLTKDFSRVGKKSAQQICKLARVPYSRKPQELSLDELERLHKAMQMVKLVAPPTDVLSPLGEDLIIEGLKKEVEAEHFVAVSRPPSVYSGFPFIVEVGLAYGGNLSPEEPVKIIRYANKVPLLYHAKDCVATEAVTEVDWRRYGFSQPSGQLPIGPLVILIHFASVWVPYTSEGKQAIASYPEILKEMKLALQEAGRKLATYIRHKVKLRERQLRRELFARYIPEVAESLSKLTKGDKELIKKKLEEYIKKKTEVGESEGGEGKT